jgi:citronellol/citronellal dehydrogenase
MSGQYHSVFEPGLFKGCHFLVTGGGSGIGRCIAHEVAHLGARTLIMGRTESKLYRVASEIAEDGGEADYVVCDVRDEVQVNKLVKERCEQKPINGLVNCAGGQFPALLSEMSVRGFEAVVKNNLSSAFIVSLAVYEHAMKDNGGAIVNITADQEGGMPLMGHSGAARAGVENLTATAALEWAAEGIRVNAVAPGYIESSGFDTYTDERMTRAIREFPRYTPLGRYGLESEISAATCFLLSPAAAFITGQVLRVDGGFSLNTNTPMLLQGEDPKPQRSYDGFHRRVVPGILSD